MGGGNFGWRRCSRHVMAGLVPAIPAPPMPVGMAGTSPAMTVETPFASALRLILMRMGLVPAIFAAAVLVQMAGSSPAITCVGPVPYVNI